MKVTKKDRLTREEKEIPTCCEINGCDGKKKIQVMAAWGNKTTKTICTKPDCLKRKATCPGKETSALDV